jgi:hypothetical protein
MPDLHSSSTPAGGQPSAARAAAPRIDDAYDFALGCECADPALQIERWCQETAAPALTHGEPH